MKTNDSNTSTEQTQQQRHHTLIPIEFYESIPDKVSIKKLPSSVRNYYYEQLNIIKSFESVDKVAKRMSVSDLCQREYKSTRPTKSVNFSIKTVELNNTSPKFRNNLSLTSTSSYSTTESTAKCCSCSCSDLLKYMKSRRGQTLITQITLVSAVIITIVTLIAALTTMSLLIMSAVAECVLQIVSEIILWWTARTMELSDRRIYPFGRTRLEPTAIVIISSIICVHSLQIVVEGFQNIIEMMTTSNTQPFITDTAIILLCCIIVVKLVMFIICKYLANTLSVETLAEDQSTEMIYHIVVLTLSTLSVRTGIPNMKYLDPVGAILVSLYIIFKWFRIGRDHVRSLTGHVASAGLHQKICYLVLTHHPSIVAVDTLLAVYFGQNFMVEIHLVLPRDMTLADAHDIGAALQRKLEALPEVELASVHIEYEVKCYYDRASHKAFDII